MSDVIVSQLSHLYGMSLSPSSSPQTDKTAMVAISVVLFQKCLRTIEDGCFAFKVET